MKYGSVCSGIEAATVAWHSLDWEPQFFSEIEKFPCAVLQHHYPRVPNFGDLTKFQQWPDARISLLVGGTPCQSFSVAGLRQGMADPRGNLALTYCGVAERYRPRWLVWENVPGVLSSGDGRDFGSFLGALARLGYGVAYRVFDAQHFGVPQRRRRVFVVGYLGDWRRAAAVLFEPPSMRRDLATSRNQKADIARTVTTGTGRRYDPDTEDIVLGIADIRNGRVGQVSPTLQSHHKSYSVNAMPICFQTCGSNIHIDQRVAGTIGSNADRTSGSYPMVTAWKECTSGTRLMGDKHPTITATKGSRRMEGVVGAITSGSSKGGGWRAGADEAGNGQIIATDRARRLTPTECERLQGLPDDYTKIPGSSDSQRYKAVGNSMAIPCMTWIGRRIQMVDTLFDP